jgi:hypothetical protein
MKRPTMDSSNMVPLEMCARHNKPPSKFARFNQPRLNTIPSFYAYSVDVIASLPVYTSRAIEIDHVAAGVAQRPCAR